MGTNVVPAAKYSSGCTIVAIMRIVVFAGIPASARYHIWNMPKITPAKRPPTAPRSIIRRWESHLDVVASAMFLPLELQCRVPYAMSLLRAGALDGLVEY